MKQHMQRHDHDTRQRDALGHLITNARLGWDRC